LPEYLATLPPTEATGWEYVKLYRASAPKRLRYPASEIEAGGYFSLEFIELWITKRPQDFASGFIECFRAFNK
jgi:16S rRNA (adenine1518-N6/adenine1519-N6)-dimethyltransferase